MLTNWRSWCRLCANPETLIKLESRSEISQIVEKYFMLTLSPFCNVCCECYEFVSKLAKFGEKCIRSDKMFSELLMDNMNILENDLPNLRFRHGVDEELKLSDIIENESLNDNMFEISYDKVDQSTDTIDLPANDEEPEEPEVKDENSSKAEVFKIMRKRRGRPRRVAANKKKSESVDYEESAYPEDEETDNYEKVAMPGKRKIQEPVVEENIQKEEDISDGGIDNDFAFDELIELNVDSEDDKPLVVRGKSKRSRRIQEEEDTEKLEEIKEEETAVPELIQCSLCRKSYKSRSNYEQHLLTKHIEPDEAQYTCKSCSKQFSSYKKLRIHEMVHLPDALKLVHPCTYCDKKFTKQVNVQAHIRAIHIGDRPFICEECGKSFGTKGALKEHQITHSDERPFQCAYCPKKFKNLPRLKTHEDIHNDTVYVCPHCGLQLNTKRTLKMHMVVHSDQKKYKCQYCGNEYKRSKALKNHLILHTGLRPYLCPFCDKTFANGSNCRSHKKKAHPLELAQLEASGQATRVTNIPKLEHLQPKANQQMVPTNCILSNTTETIIQQQQTTIINSTNVMQAVLHQLPNPMITAIEDDITSTNLQIPIHDIHIPTHTISTVSLIQANDM